MLKHIAGLICGSILLASPALAEEAAAPTPFSDSLRLLGLIMADGSISPEEKPLIEELRTATGPITLDVDGSQQTFLRPDADGRSLLAFFYTPANLNDLWLVDTDKMRLFVHIAEVAPATEDRLTKFAASKFNEKVETSNISNGYGPISALLFDYFEKYKDLQGADNNMARKIAYDAMVMVDKYHNDEVPYFIYNWLIPNEYVDPYDYEDEDYYSDDPDEE